MDHLTYSPGLVTCDFWLLQILKNDLKGQKICRHPLHPLTHKYVTERYSGKWPPRMFPAMVLSSHEVPNLRGMHFVIIWLNFKVIPKNITVGNQSLIKINCLIFPNEQYQKSLSIAMLCNPHEKTPNHLPWTQHWSKSPCHYVDQLKQIMKKCNINQKNWDKFNSKLFTLMSNYFEYSVFFLKKNDIRTLRTYAKDRKLAKYSSVWTNVPCKYRSCKPTKS